MQLIQNIKRKSVTRNIMALLAAMALSAAMATDALAAGHGAGGHRGGHVTGGFSGLDRVPSTPPVFNPSSPYTVPQSHETPVSPASPGSIFGNP
jgi:hypothetical protein